MLALILLCLALILLGVIPSTPKPIGWIVFGFALFALILILGNRFNVFHVGR